MDKDRNNSKWEVVPLDTNPYFSETIPSCKPRLSRQTYYETGIYSFYREQNWLSAISFFESSIKANDQPAMSHYYIARCKAHLGKNKEAINHFEIGMKLFPNSSVIRQEYAFFIHYQLNDLKKALKHYRICEKINEKEKKKNGGYSKHKAAIIGRGKYHTDYGKCCDDLDLKIEAEKNYKLALNTCVGMGRCHYLYAVFLYKQNRLKEADYHFRTCMRCKRRPWHILPYIDYAKLLMQLGKLDKALNYLNYALQNKTTEKHMLANLYFQFSQLFYKKKNYKLSKEYIIKAHKTDPNYSLYKKWYDQIMKTNPNIFNNINQYNNNNNNKNNRISIKSSNMNNNWFDFKLQKNNKSSYFIGPQSNFKEIYAPPNTNKNYGYYINPTNGKKCKCPYCKDSLLNNNNNNNNKNNNEYKNISEDDYVNDNEIVFKIGDKVQCDKYNGYVVIREINFDNDQKMKYCVVTTQNMETVSVWIDELCPVIDNIDKNDDRKSVVGNKSDISSIISNSTDSKSNNNIFENQKSYMNEYNNFDNRKFDNIDIDQEIKILQKKKRKMNKIKKKISIQNMTIGEKEFKILLNECSNSINKHFNLFKKYNLNNVCCLQFIHYDLLKKNINMSDKEVDKFLNMQHKFMRDMNNFKNLISCISNLENNNEKYIKLFRNNGILTQNAFNRNIKNPKDILDIINNEIHAIIIWEKLNNDIA